MISKNKNSNNCPGSEVILELLRAEHEQVKKRTDIIRELIQYNCASGNQKGQLQSLMKLDRAIDNFQEKVKSTETNTVNSHYSRNTEMTNNYNPYLQLSTNNWDSRHRRCFLDYDPKLDKPNRLLVNNYYNNFLRGEEAVNSGFGKQTSPLKKLFSPQNKTNTVSSHYPRSTEKSSNPVIKKPSSPISKRSSSDREKKPSASLSRLPTYSQVLRSEESKSRTQTPEIFSSDIVSQQSSIKSKKSSRKKTKKNKETVNTASSTECIDKAELPACMVKEDLKCEILDYKMQVNRLLQQITDLKVAARKYEEEKSDWIFEKRRQIQILQQLRDASYEETKAAMKLTIWKPNDIQTDPCQYEEVKKNWLLCKKNQIELLEKLRAVSLCEIRKNIQKICCPTTIVDCDDYQRKPIPQLSINDPSAMENCTKELFSNEHFSIRVCSPIGEQNKNDMKVPENYNINIMMKSNNSRNMNNMIPNWPSQKFQIDQSDRTANWNSNVETINLINKQYETYFNENIRNQKNQSSIHPKSMQNDLYLMNLKKQIESTLGSKLFDNTYRLLKNLNCAELIINHDKMDGSSNSLDTSPDSLLKESVAGMVFRYIKEENKLKQM